MFDGPFWSCRHDALVGQVARGDQCEDGVDDLFVHSDRVPLDLGPLQLGRDIEGLDGLVENGRDLECRVGPAAQCADPHETVPGLRTLVAVDVQGYGNG
jgi:hypothetical protein